MQALMDAHNACSKLDRKNTYGGCQFLISRLVSWSSRSIIVFCCQLGKKNMLLQLVAPDKCFGWNLNSWTTVIVCLRYQFIVFLKVNDVSQNSVQHYITKHIDIRYHFIMDNIHKRKCRYYFCLVQWRDIWYLLKSANNIHSFLNMLEMMNHDP